MIAAISYGAFRWAAIGGHLAVLNRLFEKCSANKIQEMIAAISYGAFQKAASNGHLAVLNRLIEECIMSEKRKMIESCDYNAFRNAFSNKHTPVVNWLLPFPSVFAYAEMHRQEYHTAVNPFVSTTLTALRASRQAFETANPNAVFNVLDNSKTELYFYMIRHLIRRNDLTCLDDIRFLLDIPAVKALAHTEMTIGTSNELLRLALSIGNRPAVELLIAIPAVRTLAEQNNYYQAEQHAGVDLRQLAQNRESSMTALTTGEQERLATAIAHYQPLIQAASIDNIMTNLRETLKTRYTANPATINVKNKKI